MMEEALSAMLLATAAVTDIAGRQVTWNARKKGTDGAAIVLHRIDGQPEYDDEGEAGLEASRVQIDCWGTYRQAKKLARAVRKRLSGIQETYDDVEFQGAWIDSERDNFEVGAGAAELNSVSLDLIIHHS